MESDWIVIDTVMEKRTRKSGRNLKKIIFMVEEKKNSQRNFFFNHFKLKMVRTNKGH